MSMRGQGAGSKVKAPKTSEGHRTAIRHTIPLGIAIVLVFFAPKKFGSNFSQKSLGQASAKISPHKPKFLATSLPVF